ncbi:carbamoyl phosphate synthase large subunit [Adhaeribacter arboris]|uniref:Carbamoyl phosphate synthase large subunit n=1 Tax=Adhaeribacter arboris TaxID=2072846 RepID=A0A2T2YER0_9BACT|nr:ATP-grasp domain-containing protein [Adhaeribacter arboris]PSR53994.1 carbamoyl phosphate synthase large subunit [Adhaeribacter arboris]
MNILITSAGRRVSLVRAFKNELKVFFPDSQVFTSDMNPKLSAACNVSDGYFKMKSVAEASYINDLLELCLDQNIKLVVPTIDTELQVLANHKDNFAKQGIHVIVSSSDFISKCRDKRKINQFFEQSGIPIPAAIDKQNPTFPLFIKPYDGSLSADIFLVRGPEELTHYHMTNEKLLFMEYIDKTEHDEYTVDMYYGKDNEVKCIVPRRRIEIRGGEISKGITCKNIIVPYLKEKIGYIAGAVGCLTVQVFLNKNNNQIYGIEINPRFGGGFPLSYQSGANYPGWLIKEYLLNESISYTDNWSNNLLMLRYDDEVLVQNYEI